MPPKTKGPSNKTVEKQKQKIIEDKTFGLKNKKGAKTQQYIQSIQKQVDSNIKRQNMNRDEEKIKMEREARKEAARKAKEELDLLFKPVVEIQKVQEGVDPKSVLCAFFKQGLCKKGDKCKFSHDLNIERKAAKRSMYDDLNEANTSKDEMRDWDQAKLEEVVDKKHGSSNKGLPPTTIICKYFLDAVEKAKYGWFWECPNGPKCHYKHALPPGFILKKDKDKLEEQKELGPTLEELLETERQNLGTTLTKVTYKSFMEWKQRKRREAAEIAKEDKAKKQKNFKKGLFKGLSGRELFEFDPSIVGDSIIDEDAAIFYEREGDEYIGPIRDVDLNTFVELDDDGNEVDSQERVSMINKLNQITIDEELFENADFDDLEEELEIS